jgi:uncharacterized membrane protein
MEKLREMMKNRTFWLVVLIVVFVIIFIIYIRKRGKEKEQGEFAKQIKK